MRDGGWERPRVGRYLEWRALSRRKLPERLELVDELPVTASGKVLKQVPQGTPGASARLTKTTQA